MKIDENSFYLRYIIRSGAEDSACLEHYVNFWEDGYSVDTYILENKCVYFEDASYSGFDPDIPSSAIRISEEQYHYWVNRIAGCKEMINYFSKKYATPRNHPLEIGDYLFIDMKGIISHDEDIIEIQSREPDLILVNVVDNDTSKAGGPTILVNKYDLCYDENVLPLYEYLDCKNHVYCIPKEVYDKARSLIDYAYSELMAEMKNCIINKKTLREEKYGKYK